MDSSAFVLNKGSRVNQPPQRNTHSDNLVCYRLNGRDLLHFLYVYECLWSVSLQK